MSTVTESDGTPKLEHKTPHSPLQVYSEESSAFMNPKLSFKKKSPLNISLPFLCISHIGHTNKHLLATHQELSTLSIKDITITGGCALTAL